MLIIIIFFFCVTVTVGIFLLMRVVQRRKRPNGAMLLHGAFAATSLCLLIYYNVMHAADDLPYASMVLFIIAGLGGVTMVLYDKVFGRKLPKLIPFLHGSAALLGLVLLIWFALKHPGEVDPIAKEGQESRKPVAAERF